MRKRIKPKAIDLSQYEIRQAEYIEEYDPDEDTLGGLDLEEAEDIGAVSIPKPTKVIDTEGYYKEWS